MEGSMDFGLLQRHNIPVLPYAKASGIATALGAAGKIGYPVVAKLISPKALHKTEKGAVKLNIKNANELEKAINELKKIDRNGKFLIQKQAEPIIELIVGGRNDAQFGPTVLFGLGGIFVETFNDTSIRICPVDKNEAISMIKEIKTYPILAGARGRKKININSLAGIIASVSGIMMKQKPKELDINPLIWAKNGIYAADVRVIR